ncbi:helix-turn-helix domain-containing protein [Streptomyces lavendulocolor]|uniref:helix-turn-helix domain-containing protein n=1 Tax=Streptomyces lavendulocolor TaxID=67316 RepID=UPI003C2CEADE
MTRGTARFAPHVLKTLRASREVDGRLLSAAELARLLKTSKARVLAYESGQSVPEPGRIRQIAAIFRVPPRELYEPAQGRPHQIRDFRCYAGLTAAELAAKVGVSRATYRDVELQAILPARDDGTLPLRLSEALHIPLPMIHRALDQHPAAAERRKSIEQLLRAVSARAHEKYRPAVVDPDEPELVEIARLLRRPGTVVCRLINHELSQYRKLLHRLDEAGLAQAYAQTTRAAADAKKIAEAMESRIAVWPKRVASTLVRFLAEAVTSQQWRMMCHLLQHGIAYAAESRAGDEADQAWDGLIARGFVFQEGAKRVLAPEGVRRCIQQARYYACLYPRVASPQVRARFQRPSRRQDLGSEFRTGAE